MSDPKNISPLLDGFTLGTPFNEHHGVVCCPAIKENSNKKYIVKVISVPATQAQFDAMLLAGAYKDPGDAMEYFREIGENILQEAELLKQLSKLEGFLPYDGWQMEPISRRRLGYEVYLVGSYKRSLDKYIRKNQFTHLEAVNFALDLCAALSICRQSGFLYVDLKPTNIYVSEKKEYRIGDLGFLSLDALRYTSLPQRYFSPYTPPELTDPMNPINLTADTYAVGMILYQLYNDGKLPFSGHSPAEELPSPRHADSELADIILKAIHPDPQQRFTDPKDLGKAIVSYMQRNSVNDVPIVPVAPAEKKPEETAPVSLPEAVESQPQEPALELPAEEVIPEADPLEEPCQPEEIAADPCSSEEITASESSELSSEEPVEISSEEAIQQEEDDLPVPPEEPADTIDEPQISEPPENPEDPSDADDHEEQITLSEISEDVAKILTKANDIIAHEIPEEITWLTEEIQEDPFAFVMEDSADADPQTQEDAESSVAVAKDEPQKPKKTKHFADQTRKNKIRKFFSRCLGVLIFGGVCVCGFWYYQNMYCQTIDSITLSSTQNQITVLVETDVEESKLTVRCTDESGKRYTESFHGGKATFENLKPSTQYNIQVDISGFHKLTGQAAEVITTQATTQILSFQAIAGSENGSVLLDFTVDGEEPDFWNIRYQTEGEDERLETITNHSTQITGLTVGKVYTFTLDGGRNFDVGGETSIEFLATRLILAENITVESENGSDITIHWDTPGDAVVENWAVRLYDGYGFEESLDVTDNSVSFTGIDPANHYTVEITAAGMTQPSSFEISQNPIIISDFHVDESSKTEMKLTWDHTGDAPEDGWVLLYTVDGSGTQIVPCEKATAKITPMIPGANYVLELQSADERTVFNNRIYHQASDAQVFTQHNFVQENVTIDLLKTPEDPEWAFETISESDFTNTFEAGTSASMVLRSSSAVYLPGSNTQILFVFRDAYDNVLPEMVLEESLIWKNIWMSGDSKIGELDIPRLPHIPGNYKLQLYINGCFVREFDITITG